MRACSQARKNVDRGRKSLVPLLWLFWRSSYTRKGDKMTLLGKINFIYVYLIYRKSISFMKVKRQISLGFRDLAPLQLMINFWNKKSIQLFLIVHFILAALFLDTSCQIIKFYYTKSGFGSGHEVNATRSKPPSFPLLSHCLLFRSDLLTECVEHIRDLRNSGN